MNDRIKAFWFLAFALLASPTRADTLYVTNTMAGTVSEVTADGHERVFASGLAGPTYITYCDGNLYVACANTAIDRISRTGAVSVFAANFGAKLIIGLATDHRGNIFAVDNSTGMIFKISSDGVVSRWGSIDSGHWNGDVSLQGLAMDKEGNLFTTYEDRMLSFPDGKILEVSSTGHTNLFASNLPGRPCSLTFDRKGNLIVANANNDTLSKITPTGVVTTYPNGLYGRPTTLVMDSQDNLYAGCNYPNGGFICKVTPAGVVSFFAKLPGLTQMAIMPTFTDDSNAATTTPSALQISGMVIFLASPAIILVVVLVLWLVLRKKRAAQ